MDHYLDIHIRPDPEFSAPQLMNALFAKLHRALVELKSDDIGVSFPGVDEKRPALGDTLRLHGTLNRLQTLMAQPWLNGMRDHLILGAPARVPTQVQYRSVSRVQSDSNPERLRRRLMRRHSLSEEEARRRIPDNAARMLKLPFINLHSQSTGQHFRLFIRHGTVQSKTEPGKFSCYGLSPNATVPWF